MSIKQPSFKGKMIFLTFLILILPGIRPASGQGCSDAGICSAAGIGVMAHPLDSPTRLALTETFGLGEKNTLHFRTEFRMDWNIWTGIAVQFKLPYEIISGNLASTQGPGDVSAMLSLSIYEAQKTALILNIGGIIPTGDSDKSKEGLSLPMAYQTSQGTFDLLAGFTFLFGTMDIAAGYQHSYGGNKNLFTYELWNGNADALTYYESARLKRGDDVVLRLQKNFIRPKAYYSVAILPVYRLQEDRIMKDNIDTPVKGSSGLTLNLNGSAEFKLSKSWTFNLIGGFPVLRRESIPDGLTRTFVISAGIGLNFPD